MIQQTMSSVGVDSLCLIKSKVNAGQLIRKFSIAPYFPLLTSLMEMMILFSSRTWQLLILPIHALMTVIQ